MVEQGTHKPLVGSSNLPPGTCRQWLGFTYFAVLRAVTISVQLSKRLGDRLEIVAKKEVPTLNEAREIERSLKRKKNPKLAIYHLQH